MANLYLTNPLLSIQFPKEGGLENRLSEFYGNVYDFFTQVQTVLNNSLNYLVPVFTASYSAQFNVTNSMQLNTTKLTVTHNLGTTDYSVDVIDPVNTTTDEITTFSYCVTNKTNNSCNIYASFAFAGTGTRNVTFKVVISNVGT